MNGAQQVLVGLLSWVGIAAAAGIFFYIFLVGDRRKKLDMAESDLSVDKDAVEREILYCLGAQGSKSAQEISASINQTWAATYLGLTRLAQRGFVKSEKVTGLRLPYSQFRDVSITDSGSHYYVSRYERKFEANIVNDHSVHKHYTVSDNGIIIDEAKNANITISQKNPVHTAQALNQLIDVVENSGNPDAQELIAAFRSELEKKEPRLAVARTLFESIKSAVPVLQGMATLTASVEDLLHR